jgi:hypothetical protein
MKLKNSVYKNILSCLVNNQPELRTNQIVSVMSRLLSEYPSKSLEYCAAHRVIHYYEKSINSLSLILESMRDEGEDEEIINLIELTNREPTINTKQEATKLCELLYDYIKYSRALKVKDKMTKAIDVLEDDEANVRDTVKALQQVSNEVANACNITTISSSSSSFDTNDLEAMEYAVAEAQESRAPDRVIVTGIRSLNVLLSPGYLPGALYVYAGAPGNYKSGMLLESHVDTCRFNEHIKATTNGKIPISMYITMENSMPQTIRRLWAILYPTADLSAFTVKEAAAMINSALTEKGIRSVILYYGYREKSTYDLQDIIRSFNDDKHVVVAVYLDYIKRIRPGRTDTAAVSSEKAELNTIMNELKATTIQFGLPIVTGHQLNRQAQAALDSLAQTGNIDKSYEVLGRSQIGSAFEVVEVADWLGIINIENHRDMKYIMIKAAKQREKDGKDADVFNGIRHPFLEADSFALKTDLNEKVPLSEPIYQGRQRTNYIATNNMSKI